MKRFMSSIKTQRFEVFFKNQSCQKNKTPIISELSLSPSSGNDFISDKNWPIYMGTD
jgi:hypothetical protein